MPTRRADRAHARSLRELHLATPPAGGDESARVARRDARGTTAGAAAFKPLYEMLRHDQKKLRQDLILSGGWMPKSRQPNRT